MTTNAEEFRRSAQELVHEFSTGDHILRKVTESYSVETSETSESFEDHTAPAARYGITFKDTQKYNYDTNWCNVAMAGLDLPDVTPETGDLVVFPDGSVHLILGIDTDQYKACYFLHVAEETWR